MTDEAEDLARRLHKESCQRKGIYDDAKIADYWGGCDQNIWRNKVKRRTDGHVGSCPGFADN